MSVRNYLAGTVVITLAFGLSLLLIPSQLTNLYNLQLSPGGLLVAGLR